MNRRGFFSRIAGAAVAVGALRSAPTPRVWFTPAKEGDLVFVAGTVLITREEAERKDFQALLRSKLENHRQSTMRIVAEQVEKKFGRVVEYAENTTDA
jgi:hypothetical protein